MSNPVRTILVVDDDRSIGDMLTKVLAKLGYRTVVADNVDTALARVWNESPPIDVVLTDVCMPDISGIDLLEQVHRINPQLPVILMTAYADMATIGVAIRKKAFDFVTKPLDLSELALTMEKAIKHVTLLELEQNYLHALEETVAQRTSELNMRHEDLKALFRQVEAIKAEWERTMDCIGDIVIVAAGDGTIRRCNRALRDFCDIPYQEIVGNEWRSFLSNFGLHPPCPDPTGTKLHHHASNRWFILNCYPYTDPVDEAVSGQVITIVDTTELTRTAEKLALAYEELQTTQMQMLQREKMASIGQLAAGVAHEINNPIGFISSNLTTLGKYVERMSAFVNLLSELCPTDGDDRARLEKTRQELKIDRILADISPLINESLDGAGRVRTIVQDLKSFSRTDEGEFKMATIEECLDSAVNIVWNELKYKVTLDKNYGTLPTVRCYPQQLNQVFMNLLVNAADAIDKAGKITINTRYESDNIFVTISDTGCGIPSERLGRIFEPFFTTKELGKGTGLGLSISYDIVKRHNGEITVESEPDKGTTFTVRIPVA
jgi:two-component system NtrC family sensor kinase